MLIEGLDSGKPIIVKNVREYFAKRKPAFLRRMKLDKKLGTMKFGLRSSAPDEDDAAGEGHQVYATEGMQHQTAEFVFSNKCWRRTASRGESDRLRLRRKWRAVYRLLISRIIFPTADANSKRLQLTDAMDTNTSSSGISSIIS